MIKRVCFLLFVGLISTQLWALEGSAEQGKAKSTPCVACHNADGNSTMPTWPKLAGQHEKYLVTQLMEFRKADKGKRNNAVMYPMVQNLSDQDIHDLAAYFSSQQISANEAKGDITRGEQLYKGGDLAKGITACAACHGPNGAGNGAANFPHLSYQHAEYTAQQLHNFKEGARKAPMMTAIAANMSDDDITAVSNYIAGLH